MYYSRFEKMLNKDLAHENEYSNIIFLCIGTSKLIGDSIGPHVGDKLKIIENDYIKVYGTTENNVDFLNSKYVIEKIYKEYNNPYIITIDAALSNIYKKGDIVTGNGYIKLGKALEKNICFYSNINIKCIMGKYYIDKEQNLKELQAVKIEEISKMAEIIYKKIKNILIKFRINV